MEWNKIPDLTLEYKYDEQKIEKPKNLAKMIEIARELSTEFKFVRIDLYNVDGDIFFGEATFHPEAGFGKFSINEFELIFGNLLDIN